VDKHFVRFLRGLPRNLRILSPKSSLSLARGIVEVSNATMERALRLISVERGYDPRDFTLICFGGAGGLHAADLARSLGLTGVIVPMHPGAFSALGILLSDIVRDVSQSVLLTVPGKEKMNSRVSPSNVKLRRFLKDLERRFESIEQKARVELRREHFKVDRAQIERRLSVRYIGQAYELSVPFTPTFPMRFHFEHEKAYGYAQPMQPLEIVNLQVRIKLPTSNPPGRAKRIRKLLDPRRAIVKRKLVWFDRQFVPTTLYERQRLGSGMKLTGPAIIVEYSSTTVVPPDFTCRVDEHLNLRLTQHAH
jgi:N-methylhydantoinase A